MTNMVTADGLDDELDSSETCAEPVKLPLRSVHTTNLPEIFRQLDISVFVSTYQAGKLIVLRADGDKLNTHFRAFPQPMGIALAGNRLAIGTEMQVWEYHNVPAVADKLEPTHRHDACFLPRRAHHTGNVQIHEMAWVGEELWFVNTLFSCLCTRSDEHSFIPQWRPPFVSAYAPEDRCHLNGMGVVDGAVRFATALGQTDKQGGWRERKVDGGVLLDVPSGDVIAADLCMPHSPRFYDGRIWVLNSGEGGVGVIDPQNGKYQELCRLPGFTRGLSFHGRLAIVGLSQVRESAVFSGIPIANLEKRTCGIWIINIDTGQTIGFVKFEDAVQEIFAVEVLAGCHYPDVINDDPKIMASSYVLPDEALGDVPNTLQANDTVRSNHKKK